MVRVFEPYLPLIHSRSHRRSQDTRTQDPEELYVKQNRIGALMTCTPLSSQLLKVCPKFITGKGSFGEVYKGSVYHHNPPINLLCVMLQRLALTSEHKKPSPSKSSTLKALKTRLRISNRKFKSFPSLIQRTSQSGLPPPSPSCLVLLTFI